MKQSRQTYPIFLTLLIASIIGLGNTMHSSNNAFAQYYKQPHHIPVLHKITLAVEEIPLLGGNLYAYKMVQHLVTDMDTGNTIKDLTNNYEPGPTIPGPTLIIDEGDVVSLTLENNIQSRGENAMVSVHVHGIHYPITSDGTLQVTNSVGDQGINPGDTITYSWTAGPGTVGTWPYHDHTLGLNTIGKDPNGLEMSGLFGTLIINDGDGYTNALINGEPEIVNIDDISKDVICWISDDAFWCNEAVNNYGEYNHKALWENPTIKAVNKDLVRFHLLGIGTDFTVFQLSGYEWLKPGTDQIINEKEIGPLAVHVFTVVADEGDSQYRDIIQSHFKSGMFGDFIVDDMGVSIPGEQPGEA